MSADATPYRVRIGGLVFEWDRNRTMWPAATSQIQGLRWWWIGPLYVTWTPRSMRVDGE